MAEIRLRQSTQEDYDFLYTLHRAALKDYVDQIWGWDEAWQAAHFLEKFDLSAKRIIQQDGEDIGCMAVMDEDDHIFLSYLALALYERLGFVVTDTTEMHFMMIAHPPPLV